MNWMMGQGVLAERLLDGELSESQIAKENRARCTCGITSSYSMNSQRFGISAREGSQICNRSIKF